MILGCTMRAMDTAARAIGYIDWRGDERGTILFMKVLFVPLANWHNQK
jgi:hypothetical protein